MLIYLSNCIFILTYERSATFFDRVFFAGATDRMRIESTLPYCFNIFFSS